MMEAAHFGFILAAYTVTALVLGAVTLAILLDGRAQSRLVAKLEQHATVRGPRAPKGDEVA